MQTVTKSTVQHLAARLIEQNFSNPFGPKVANVL